MKLRRTLLGFLCALMLAVVVGSGSLRAQDACSDADAGIAWALQGINGANDDLDWAIWNLQMNYQYGENTGPHDNAYYQAEIASDYNEIDTMSTIIDGYNADKRAAGCPF